MTLAGKADVIKQLHKDLESEGLFARIMNVDIPFHSPILAPIEQECILDLFSLYFFLYLNYFNFLDLSKTRLQ